MINKPSLLTKLTLTVAGLVFLAVFAAVFLGLMTAVLMCAAQPFSSLTWLGKLCLTFALYRLSVQISREDPVAHLRTLLAIWSQR